MKTYKDMTLDEQNALWDAVRSHPFTVSRLPDGTYMVPVESQSAEIRACIKVAPYHVIDGIGEWTGFSTNGSQYWRFTLEGLIRFHIVRRALREGKEPSPFWTALYYPRSGKYVPLPRIGMRPYQTGDRQ